MQEPRSRRTATPRGTGPQTLLRRLVSELGRIRTRLLAVNLIVVLVPAAGLEFARIYEEQLLGALQRDMTNQAALAGSLVEIQLARGEPLGSELQAEVLERAARRTRTRIRLVDPARGVVADSHEHGPPEGKEPAPPSLARGDVTVRWRSERTAGVPDLMTRPEMVEALAGRRSAHTRVAEHPPAVYLFVGEPVRHAGSVAGVVYVVRSTNPVLFELHRIRTGLSVVLMVAMAFTACVTLALAFTISRPIERISRAAKRIAAGERQVVVPTGGGGELGELGEALSVMTRRLESRLDYVRDFAADVAHELKSPLTSIRGAAELLTEGAADDPEARARFLRNIELDAARLDRLVSRLLELSRVEASSVSPTVLDLRTLVRRAVERSETPDLTLELRYDSRRTAVVARESDLDTALLNLLDNAMRYSPDGGKVTLAVEDAADGRVAISIADQGPGIDPANLPRVFDRFFTTDGERDGTGLGLAIVKSVAEAHGGEIRVESRPGDGAKFTLLLPGDIPGSG